MFKIKQEGILHTVEAVTPTTIYYTEDMTGVSKTIDREEFKKLRKNNVIQFWRK